MRREARWIPYTAAVVWKGCITCTLILLWAGCVQAVCGLWITALPLSMGRAQAVHMLSMAGCRLCMLSTPPLPCREPRCASGRVIGAGRRLLLPVRMQAVRVVRPRGPPQPAQGRDARSTVGMREERKARQAGAGGAPERKRLMGSVAWFVEPAAACVLALLLCMRAGKRRGKLRALLYGIALLLVLLSCSPALRKGFMLRALLRLLG